MVVEHALNVAGIFGMLCVADNTLTKYTSLKGIYYLIHAIYSIAIVRATLSDVIYTWAQFRSHIYVQNTYALELFFALYFYKLFMHRCKFRMNDWLHNLMIGIVLPIGGRFSALLGYSLFFTTGLSEGIDSIVGFLVRNNWLSQRTRKNIHAWLNVWIRSPGCITMVGYAICYAYTSPPDTDVWYMVTIVAVLNYWNGQHVMRNVVETATLYNLN